MKNRLKKSEIFGAIFVMVFSGTLMHFFYDWSGKNPIVALFAPYNESTWEHLKLLFFPVLIYSVFQYAYIVVQYSSSYRKTCRNREWCIDDCHRFLHVYGGFQTSNSWIDVTLFYLSVIVCYRVAYSITRQEKYQGQQKYCPDLPDWYYAVIFLSFCFVNGFLKTRIWS